MDLSNTNQQSLGMKAARYGEPAGTGLDRAGFPTDGMTVAVIIPTYNHAHFLRDAIMSVLAQTRQADEIIVVDDGSTDDPATVVAKFPTVQLIRQENRGLSAARNKGLWNCKSSYVVFLDADDRLLPTALEAGLTYIAGHPNWAFVYGGHRRISEDGRALGPDSFSPINGDAYLTFARTNLVGPPATVLYRRDCLAVVNGFDETLRRCQDHDIYLRMAQRYPIASHPTIVAEYRKHGQAMSNDHVEMLKEVLLVLDLDEARTSAEPHRAALREGRTYYRNLYTSRMLGAASVRWRANHSIGILGRDLIQAIRWSPYHTIRSLLRPFARRASQLLPRSAVEWIQRTRGRPYRIPIGSVRFGDLKRLSPISDNFGSDRGTPVDRYYIESFLAQNAGDIRGRVLEADNNIYTRRFGGARAERSDVLSVEVNSQATIVGDLAQAGTLPAAAFDCIILTQVLQLIFDVRGAVATSYRALKPGGVLLITVPGVTKMGVKSWPWYWSFTEAALRRLLADQFGEDGVSIEGHGNIFAATAFLYGIALEELDVSDLNTNDSAYPVTVAARAIKRKDA